MPNSITNNHLLITTLVLLLMLGGCNRHNHRESILKDRNQGYIEAKMEFPSGITDHFPEILDEDFQQMSVTYPAGAYGPGMASIFLSLKSDSSELRDIERKLLRVNAIKVDYNSPRLIIIGDTTDFSHINNAVPVPSFYDFENDFGLNSIKLDSLFDLYVIESKRGKYLAVEYIPENSNLPESWENGFSRGVGIDYYGNKILYWLVVW